MRNILNDRLLPALLALQGEEPGVGEQIGEKTREQVEQRTGEVGEVAQNIVVRVPELAATGIRIASIFLLAFVINRLLRRLIKRFVGRVETDPGVAKLVEEKRAQTLAAVLRAGAAALVWTVALLLVLGEAGIDIGPLVAAAGVGGIALGFGAQTLVQDVISGFFILLEDQFHVDDVITVGGVSGVVESVTLRATTLRDLDGKVHVVPNGEIRVTTNMTKGFSRYLFSLPVPYDADPDQASQLARDALEEMRREPEYAGAILAPLEVLGVDEYGESEIQVKVYVETIAGKQWAVGRELRRRIKRAYDAAGLSIPFPHREVILRQAPPSEEVHGDGEGG